jgi:hypothetical protein
MLFYDRTSDFLFILIVFVFFENKSFITAIDGCLTKAELIKFTLNFLYFGFSLLHFCNLIKGFLGSGLHITLEFLDPTARLIVLAKS